VFLTIRRRRVYFIAGPTAVGKTAAAIAIAKRLSAEVVSADSRQVYIGMDIGTSKPSAAQRKAVRHHLVDVIRPDEDYNVALFKDQALEAIDDIHARRRTAMVVGGTGLYLRALLEGLTFQGVGRDDDIRAEIERDIEARGGAAVYEELKRLDPEACEKIHPNNIPRMVRALEVIRITGRPFSEVVDKPAGKEGPAHDYVAVCLNVDRDALYRRIDRRVEEMVHSGWPDEVKRLIEEGYSADLRAMNALGYREMVDYIEGRISLREAIDAIRKATRNFAQRQLTFFRGMTGLKWVDVDTSTGAEDMASQLAEAMGIE
jgi:tRNA dimethylallyltransferase